MLLSLIKKHPDDSSYSSYKYLIHDVDEFFSKCGYAFPDDVNKFRDKHKTKNRRTYKYTVDLAVDLEKYLEKKTEYECRISVKTIPKTKFDISELYNFELFKHDKSKFILLILDIMSSKCEFKKKWKSEKELIERNNCHGENEICDNCYYHLMLFRNLLKIFEERNDTQTIRTERTERTIRPERSKRHDRSNRDNRDNKRDRHDRDNRENRFERNERNMKNEHDENKKHSNNKNDKSKEKSDIKSDNKFERQDMFETRYIEEDELFTD